MSADADRLLAILKDHHVSPDVLERDVPAFPDAVKEEAADRLARAAEPPPAQALARLPMIRTPRNEQDIATVLRAGLGAQDASARKFAIYGLQALDVPDAPDAALAALSDDDDQVVTAAASVLLPAAAGDPQVASALREVYHAREGQEEFHTSVSMLKARLIDPGEPA